MIVATQSEATEPVQRPPEVVWEVCCKTERAWVKQYARIVKFLRAGVSVVVVLDEATASAVVYRPDQLPQIFEKNEVLTIPDVLPGFAVPVAQFFEE